MSYRDFESELKQLPKEIQDFYYDKLSKEGASYLVLRIDEVVEEYNKEKSKSDEEKRKDEGIKNRELRIKEAQTFQVDAIRILNELMKERGFSEDDFKLELEIINRELKPIDSPADGNRLKNNRKRSMGKNILKIDRSQPFNPATFPGLNSQCSIWRGPANGKGLTGKEDQDENSLLLDEIDLDQIETVTMLNNEETSIKGEKKLKRLKDSNYIRLDAKIFETLWNNQNLIPEKWKEKINGNIQCIFFDGTVLYNSIGGRYVLYLYWGDDGWSWDCYWLGLDWCVYNPSAVIAPQTGQASA